MTPHCQHPQRWRASCPGFPPSSPASCEPSSPSGIPPAPDCLLPLGPYGRPGSRDVPDQSSCASGELAWHCGDLNCFFLFPGACSFLLCLQLWEPAPSMPSLEGLEQVRHARQLSCPPAPAVHPRVAYPDRSTTCFRKVQVPRHRSLLGC